MSSHGAAVPTRLLHTVETWAAVDLPQQLLTCSSCGGIHYWTKE
jgi:hypothetical protein